MKDNLVGSTVQIKSSGDIGLIIDYSREDNMYVISKKSKVNLGAPVISGYLYCEFSVLTFEGCSGQQEINVNTYEITRFIKSMKKHPQYLG